MNMQLLSTQCAKRRILITSAISSQSEQSVTIAKSIRNMTTTLIQWGNIVLRTSSTLMYLNVLHRTLWYFGVLRSTLRYFTVQ